MIFQPPMRKLKSLANGKSPSCNRKNVSQSRKGRKRDIDFKYWFLFAFYSQSLLLNLRLFFSSSSSSLHKRANIAPLRHTIPAFDNYDFHSFTSFFLGLDLDCMRTGFAHFSGEKFSRKFFQLQLLLSHYYSYLLHRWCVLSMPNAIACPLTVRKKKVHKNVWVICENEKYTCSCEKKIYY